MSGHSKWATIKRKKGAIDKAKGKTFAKLARQLEVATREGASGDISSNAALRTIVSKAKAAHMTNDAIDRAIKRGLGEQSGASYESITYEAYAPGGVAMLIDALTDNRNRTASDVRSLFSKWGGAMAEPGSVGWQFSRKGIIQVGKEVSEDDIMVVALDHGAEDIVDEGDSWRVTCDSSSCLRPEGRTRSRWNRRSVGNVDDGLVHVGTRDRCGDREVDRAHHGRP